MTAGYDPAIAERHPHFQNTTDFARHWGPQERVPTQT
jgi:hypothetical protein